jgi:hypothetical protein
MRSGRSKDGNSSGFRLREQCRELDESNHTTREELTQRGDNEVKSSSIQVAEREAGRAHVPKDAENNTPGNKAVFDGCCAALILGREKDGEMPH